MKKVLLPLLAAVAMTAAGFAGGVEDAQAGLDALNQASFDKSIKLFTKAIGSGELSNEDMEFAYYNRGIANLWKKKYEDAVSDFMVAVRMNRDDVSAQSYLDYAKEYLEHKPPPMPMDLDKAINGLVGALFSPLLKGEAVKQWLEIDPLLQHCLTFQYGMEPMQLAGTSTMPDNEMLDQYFESCQQMIQDSAPPQPAPKKKK